MRDYLFRGKPKYETHYYFFEKVHKENCIDGFVCGSLVVDGDRYFIAVSSLCSINSVINNGIISMIEVIPETVGQYTGLTDKNGKKIFEGDIVSRYVNRLDKRVNASVKNNTTVASWVCEFFLYKDKEQVFLANRVGKNDCYVIGNIHDNPELLKGGEEE